jgi:hypothetical protein
MDGEEEKKESPWIAFVCMDKLKKMFGALKIEVFEKSKQNIKRFIFYAWVSKKQISA